MAAASSSAAGPEAKAENIELMDPNNISSVRIEEDSRVRQAAAAERRRVGRSQRLTPMENLRQKMNKSLDNASDWPDLPICEYRKEIIEKVHQNQVLIVIGETGSGTSEVFVLLFPTANRCQEKQLKFPSFLRHCHSSA